MLDSFKTTYQKSHRFDSKPGAFRKNVNHWILWQFGQIKRWRWAAVAR